MTKKHFITIAGGFKARLKALTENANTIEIAALLRNENRRCAVMFADIAKADNARFDRERFLAACGF